MRLFANGIDKFIGDAVMVVFGAPAKLDKYEQAQRAVACGLEMQSRMPFITKPGRMRALMHSRCALVFTMKTQSLETLVHERSDYTCIGPVVNQRRALRHPALRAKFSYRQQ